MKSAFAGEEWSRTTRIAALFAKSFAVQQRLATHAITFAYLTALTLLLIERLDAQRHAWSLDISQIEMQA